MSGSLTVVYAAVGHGSFFVGVTFTEAPLSYQWRKNGVNIAGATDFKRARQFTPTFVAKD